MATRVTQAIVRGRSLRSTNKGWLNAAKGMPQSTSAVPVGSDSSSRSGGDAFSSQKLMEDEKQYSAHNYHPIPVVFSRAKNAYVWDPEGPIVWASYFNGHPRRMALIVSCCGCFHGRTLAAISMSCDNEATRGFWPLLQGNLKVDFGDSDALESVLKEHGENIAAFLFEPIQGEAGVVIPPEGYIQRVRELCSKHNVLMVADEIQTGMARTGQLLAVDWEGVRPDMVILGKALGAGVIPVSAVLADKEVMLCINPGEHGSTFGGNPLASAVGIAALEIIQDEHLAERSADLGEKFRSSLRKIQDMYPELIKEVRGRGLLNAVELDSGGLRNVSAFDLCVALKDRGILAKPTHNTIIRLSPPLTISEEQLNEAVAAFQQVLEVDFPQLKMQTVNKSLEEVNVCDRCGRTV